MAWDEMALVPVLTSSVVFTALEVYDNTFRCGAVEIELYTGISKETFRKRYHMFQNDKWKLPS